MKLHCSSRLLGRAVGAVWLCGAGASMEAAVGPSLSVEKAAPAQITLSWEQPGGGFGLQQAEALSDPAAWIGVTEPVVANGSRRSVVLPIAGGTRFYRLTQLGVSLGLEYLLAVRNPDGTWGEAGVTSLRDTVAVAEALTVHGRSDLVPPQSLWNQAPLLPRNRAGLAAKAGWFASASWDALDLFEGLLGAQSAEIVNASNPEYPGRWWAGETAGAGSPAETARTLRALKTSIVRGGLVVINESLAPGASSVGHPIQVSPCASKLVLRVFWLSGSAQFRVVAPDRIKYVPYNLSPQSVMIEAAVAPLDDFPVVGGEWQLMIENLAGVPIAYTAEVVVQLADGSDSSRYTTPIAWLGLNQNGDGGWGAGVRQNSQVEATAEVMRLLADLDDIVVAPEMRSRARNWLGTHRNANGGFSTTPGASTILETGLAMLALNAPGAEVPLRSSAEFLRSSQLSDGSWAHDVYLTALALRALYLPPSVGPIADQAVQTPAAFAPLALDNLVFDPDNPDDSLAWQVTGANRLRVGVVHRVASVTYTPGEKFSERLTFTATDPDGFSGSASAAFTVTGETVDQTVAPGGSFTGTHSFTGPDWIISQLPTASFDDNTRTIPIGFTYTTANLGYQPSPLEFFAEYRVSVASTVKAGTYQIRVEYKILDSSNNPLPLTGNVLTLRIAVATPGQNHPPVAEVASPQNARAGRSYSFKARGTDPDGDRLTYSLENPPAGMTIDASTGTICWIPTENQIGARQATVRVSDGRGGSATQSLSLTVARANRAPTLEVNPVPPAWIWSILPYTFRANATDPDGDPVVLAVQGPPGMTIDASGLVRWQPAVTNAGSNRFTILAMDNRGGSATRDFNVEVRVDNVPPTLQVNCPGGSLPLGTILDIFVFSRDPSGRSSIEVTVGGVRIPIDSTGRGETVLNQAGLIPVVAVATDLFGNQATNTCTLDVFDTGDGSFPVVSLTTPAEDDTVTAPINVIGTAAHTNLVDYTLELSPAETGQFTEIARGSTSVIEGVLGVLDPTTLANGDYILRLTASTEAGRSMSTEVGIAVTGQLKLGNFRLSFTDLSIPVSGIPITIARTYDSLTADEVGDFGAGWRLEFKNTRLRVNVPARTPEEIEVNLHRAYTDRTRVYVTMPGGRREMFTFRPRYKPGFANAFCGLNPKWCLYDPAFVAEPGVTDTLSIAGLHPEFAMVSVNGEYVNLAGLSFNLEDDTFGGQFRVTTKEGVVYNISPATGELLNVADPNGNTLTFTKDGVISSSGQSVAFARDAQGRITAVTDPAGRQIRYQYDGKGDLVSVTDRDTNATRFVYHAVRPHYLQEVIDPLNRTGVRSEYDEQGRLSRLIDAAGNPVQLLHNPAEDMEQVVDAMGRTNTFVYDNRGNVVQEINALNGVIQRAYDGNNNLTVEVDALGNTNRFEYDWQGNVTKRIDPLGNVTLTTYGINSQVTSTTDPLGNTTRNDYDGEGNVIRTTDAAGISTTYTYDGPGNQTSTTDANGEVTRLEYDGAGRMIRQTDALGNVTSYVYDANGNQLSQTSVVTVRPGVVRTNVTLTAYDASGRPVSTTDAAGNITRTEYDANGKTKATIDALNHRTEFLYNERGQLTNTVFADGTSSSLTYDAAGRRTSSIDRAGRTTLYEYDALGRLITTIYPDDTPVDLTDNPRTRTEYDLAGRVTAQVDERGNRTTFGYDAAGRQTSTTNALGYVTRSEYDAAGRKTADADALGRKTQSMYDVLGRRIQTLFADGTTRRTEYDALGRVMAELDQAGVKTRFEYDAQGRLAAVVDALGGRTDYRYNEQGNLISQKDANGHVTTYEYETCCQRSAVILPLGQRATTLYNAVNSVAAVTNFNGQVISYDYDQNNLLQTKQFPDGTSVQFAYTPTGRRQRITEPRGITTFEYDVRDRLLRRTDPDGRFVAYTYDAAGNRTSVTTATGTTRYDFDALNRLVQITDPDGGLTRYTYDSVNNLVRTELPNGTVRTDTFDALNRGTAIQHQGSGGLIARFTYNLDATGRRTSLVENTGRTVNWTYDQLSRLTREQITDPVDGNRTIGYAMDPVGNRLVRSDSVEGQTTYTYDANDQLLTETLAGVTTSYTYDANGNTLSRSNAHESAEYDWNPENRLVGARIRSPLSVAPSTLNYQYDTDGIRVTSAVTESGNTTATVYLIDANRPFAQVLEEWQSINHQPSTLNSSHTYGHHQPISQNRASARTYYHPDHLGSTRALTGQTGSPTDGYTFDAYGRTLRQTGPTENAYLFAGEQRDRQLTFDYLRQRYLHVASGRFFGRDPAVGPRNVPAARHPYAYAGGNPISYHDPSGRFFILEAVTVMLLSEMSYHAAAPRMPSSLLCGDCGPDVSSKLTSTLHDISDTFWNKWSFSDRTRACTAIINVFDWTTLASAWDIDPLGRIGLSGLGRNDYMLCDRTVTFHGRCFYASAVNYAMWGKINSLCRTAHVVSVGMPAAFNPLWTLPEALASTAAWKLRGAYGYGFWGQEQSQALQFTTYGYLGIAPLQGIKRCRPSNDPISDTFDWRWKPIKDF